MKKITILMVLVFMFAAGSIVLAAPGDLATGHTGNGQTVAIQGAAPYAAVNYSITSNSGFSVTFAGQKWFCITPEIDVKLFFGADTTNFVHINAGEHFDRVINPLVGVITVQPYTSGATGTVEIEYM